MRIRGFAALTLVFSLAAVASAADAKDGWRVLFDGKTLEGWEQHGGKAKYSVEDGAVVGQSVPNTENSFLCTKDKFKDFELVFEVKVEPGLNSGVQIRSRIKDKDRVWGPQIEIETAPGASGYIYGEATGRNWLSQDRPVKDVYKNGQWNQFRVVCKGPSIKTWINGKPIADLTDEQSDQDGLIGLQVHGVGKKEEPMFVRWRNIKIKELK